MFGIENGVSNSTSLSSTLLLSSHGFVKGMQGSASPKEPQNRYDWKRNVDESYFPHVEQKKVTPRVWRVGSSSQPPIVAPAGARIPKGEAEECSGALLCTSPVLTSVPWEAKGTNPPETLSEGSMAPHGGPWQPFLLGSPSSPTQTNHCLQPRQRALLRLLEQDQFAPKLFAGGGGGGCTSSWRNHHAKNSAVPGCCWLHALNPLHKCTSR